MTLLAACFTPARAQQLDVQVQLHGDTVVIDVTARVAVRRAVAWAVLTDYEHMASYVSGLTASTVLSRRGQQLTVEQSGEARRGPLHFSFTTVRAVELTPEREIQSRLVRGDFKRYAFDTRLSGEPGGPTTLVNHGEYVPDTWVPPMLGPAMIEAETRKQYGDLIAEMTRREAVGKP